MNNIIQTIRHTARAAAVLLIALLAAQTAWAWSGQGTEAEPYKITNASDLQQLATDVNSGTTYDGMYFKQTAPIDMNGKAMSPIGDNSTGGSDLSATHRFGGHYDGDNKAISHLTITGTTKYTALFGYVCGNYIQGTKQPTSLKNIVLTDCNINGSSVSGGYAAGICANATRYTTVENCRVSGTITGNYAAGGIVGLDDQGNVENCFADVTVTASVQTGNNVSYCIVGKIIGYVGTLGTVTGNYYHNDGATDATGAAITAIGQTPSSTYPDNGRATAVYAFTVPSGITLSSAATVTYNGKNYFVANTSITLTPTAANTAFKTFSVSGATYNLAANKTSATVTLGSADATVTASLQTIAGSCGTSATWALTQDDNSNYTRLTISGTGAMQDYGYNKIGGLWRTNALWGYDLTSVTIGDGITAIGDYAFCGCQQLSSITIGSGVQTIGQYSINHCDGLTEVTLPASVTSIGKGAFENSVNLARVNILKSDGVITSETAFNGCHANLLIIVPTPALALQYKDASNWSAYASKMRVALGSQLFKAIGTVDDAAYEIADATDLRNLSAAVNQNHQGCNGLTFRQTADINLSSGGNFTPIGYYNDWDQQYFYGTYDGGGYAISGLTVSGNYYYAGLFGYVKTVGTVKNVRLISPTVTSSSNAGADVGALIGGAYECTIDNCSVISPTVSATFSKSSNEVGALVGRLIEATVQNSFVISPTVSGEGSTNVGAICGHAYSSGKNYYCTLTNVYYYNSSLNAIGEHSNSNDSHVTRVGRVRKVTLGSGVTSVTPAATDMDNGFVCDGKTYYREGVTLTLPNNAPTGYLPVFSANGTAISGNTYTVNSSDGDVTLAADGTTPITYTITYHENGGTLSTDKNTYTVESDDITLDTPTREHFTFLGWYNNEGLTGTAVTTIAHGSTGNVEIWAKWGIPYIDANGNTQYCINPTVLTSGTNVNGLSAGWYVVYGNVSYDSKFRCASGDIHLILGDGAKMTVTKNDDEAIYLKSGSLTIYAQSTGSSMGQLVATSSNYDGIYVGGNVTICGGRITTTGGSSNYGIHTSSGNVTIHSGQVSATGGYFGVRVDGGNITLGLRNATDYIYANSYTASYGISVKDGQTLTDEDGNTYSGDINYYAIAGKTLYRYIENLDLAANEYDGNYWTTFYCGHTGYKIDEGENACAYTATYGTGQLTLHNQGKQIPKGTAVIIVADNDVVSMTATTDLDDFSGTNDLRGVDVDTPVANITSDLGEGTLYVLGMTTVGNEKHFGFHRYTGSMMAAHKAFVLVSGSQQAEARSLTMVFDEATGISDATRLNNKEEIKNNNWFTLDGRRLQAKPTAPGIYVNNGRKVVIK